mgnify:CR=1 FL=1
MTVAPQLQLACLALLWLQLLVQGQLQTLVAVALPLLLLLMLWQRALPRAVLLGLTAAALLLWGAGASWGDRSALLGSACNLLWLLCGLKLLEARRDHERRRVSVLLLLAVGLAGVAGQSLLASLFQGLCALLAITALLELEGGSQPLGRLLRRSSLLVGLALPLLLVTFVLLPRLEPLWSLSLDTSGRTGLSQRLAPGELASLVQDNSLVARVSFASGAPPPPQQRYWRVLVHRHFDGNSWSADPVTPQPLLALPPAASGAATLQRWLVEPTSLRQRPWAGIGLPRPESGLQLALDGTLQAAKPMAERSLYAIEAAPGSGLWQQLAPTAVDWQLPPAANPKLRALAQRWGRQGATAEARLALAQQWFLQQGFRYTLEPGALGSIDPWDHFLFETQAGFCEHFAGSFSALMRAAGVPARVVVGYQGGVWRRPLGGQPYLELRNSDAHAWSEVWLPRRGWVAVDPTAWVVPERVRRSLPDSLSLADRQRLRRPAPGWLAAAANQWSGLDYRWQLWVMGFDRQRQIQLLGNSPWQGLWALAAMALALAVGLLPLVLSLRRQGSAGDAARRHLEQVLCQLQRRGYSLHPGESFEGFCDRVGVAEPQLAETLREFCQLYSRWRFAPAAQSAVLLMRLRVLRRKLRMRSA